MSPLNDPLPGPLEGLVCASAGRTLGPFRSVDVGGMTALAGRGGVPVCLATRARTSHRSRSGAGVAGGDPTPS
eukprot:8571959-Karenia_brevis.AAC.1